MGSGPDVGVQVLALLALPAVGPAVRRPFFSLGPASLIYKTWWRHVLPFCGREDTKCAINLRTPLAALSVSEVTRPAERELTPRPSGTVPERSHQTARPETRLDSPDP